jgi:hypothetical protein
MFLHWKMEVVHKFCETKNHGVSLLYSTYIIRTVGKFGRKFAYSARNRRSVVALKNKNNVIIFILFLAAGLIGISK